MRYMSDDMINHIKGEITTLASCLKITLSSGKIIGFTDYEHDLFIDNVIYKSSNTFSASSIISTIGLSIDNLEISSILNHDDIKEKDILAGHYDYSELTLFMVNYNNLDHGMINLNQAYLGEITITDGKFKTELRGVTHKFDELIGEVYSPNCRAIFGDKRCRVDKSKFRKTGKITKINNSYSIYDSTRTERTGYFNFGNIEFINNNNKQIFEIKDYIDGNIYLFMKIPDDIHNGCEYIIDVGCDKSFSMCCKNYDNATNFRGEPHIPGRNYII